MTNLDSVLKSRDITLTTKVCLVKVKSLSRVRLFATSWTIAFQAPMSMGFSRQYTGVDCHFLLQGMAGPILCNPLDCSLPGSSVHGISQARVLEWVEISSSRGPSWIRYQTISDDKLVNDSTHTVLQDNSIAKMNPQTKVIKYLKKIKITQERH